MRIEWGQGEAIAGTPFRRVVGGEATDGRLCVLAVDMPVGEYVGEHVHEHEDQITVVMTGTVGANVGGEPIELGEGAVALLPRGIPHTQWNAGDSVARVLEIYTPSGIDAFFEQMGRLALAGGQPPATAQWAEATVSQRSP